MTLFGPTPQPARRLRFYLGIHQPAFIGKTQVPLFVSHRRLAEQKTWRQATGPWALDSGGFTELSTYGEWRTSPDQYLDAAAAYADKIGMPDWIAPQDWMCEPSMLAKTGLRVDQHQGRTIDNLLELRSKTSLHVIPVLQGWHLPDYLRHVEQYRRAGIELRDEPVVGVGSVCRRQDTQQAHVIFHSLAVLGIRTHGFGVKVSGLNTYGRYLTSADSMAWSYTARRQQIRLTECTHRRCNNCLTWALLWREGVVAA